MLNVARGGTHDLDNLQTLCAACHREKSQEEARQARAVKQARRRLPVAPHPGVR
ncbi:HNH endonuclease [Corynebacterium minutissimum]|uniref:HNH endonuclease n=1 Tax=Corynebacterium minutissimum TaxID=38301 RepID=UPI0039C2217C